MCLYSAKLNLFCILSVVNYTGNYSWDLALLIFLFEQNAKKSSIHSFDHTLLCCRNSILQLKMPCKLLAYKNLVIAMILTFHKLVSLICKVCTLWKYQMFYFFYCRELLSKQCITMISQLNQCSSWS